MRWEAGGGRRELGARRQEEEDVVKGNKGAPHTVPKAFCDLAFFLEI